MLDVGVHRLEPPASSAVLSRSDLHSRQLCCAAPRSRTTSVVTGSSARTGDRGQEPVEQQIGRIGVVVPLDRARTRRIRPTPSASNPARTRGTKSAMNTSDTAPKVLSPAP